MGVNPTPTQLQVIIGSHVGDVFEEVIRQGIANGDSEVKEAFPSFNQRNEYFQ
ncbi:hypothetical protein ABW365_00065 [Enterococcus avium]